MLILPKSLQLIAQQWTTVNIGYLLVGLGFFLISIIEELANFYELHLMNKQINYQNERLIDPSIKVNRDHQLTRLNTLVFSFWCSLFFQYVIKCCCFFFLLISTIYFRWNSHRWTNKRHNNTMGFIGCYLFSYVVDRIFGDTSSFN